VSTSIVSVQALAMRSHPFEIASRLFGSLAATVLKVNPFYINKKQICIKVI
jgi:hypothetical protein